MRVGIDQIAVEDVARAVSTHGERYLGRVYTPGEIASCRAADGSIATERLAARFAAKEATIKTLRPRDEPVPWHQIEVVSQPGGWVELELTGAARALALRGRLDRFAVSLTHEAGLAAAVVIAHSEGASA